MTKPFTYLVIHAPSGQWYYGVRYAINCSPDDLWSSYFTSSAQIRRLLDRDGQEAFSCFIRKTFHTSDEAIAWEHRVLRRVLGKSRCLNESAWPAVHQEARARGHETKRKVGDDGMTGFQRATATWIAKRHKINPETGKTYDQERLERSNVTNAKPENIMQREELNKRTSERLTKNNPSSNPEIRARMTATWYESYKNGNVPTTKGMKFPQISAKLKGRQFTLGKLWYNDGTKNNRYALDDPRSIGLIKGRLITSGAASKGFITPILTCPHCNKSGGNSNMTRYHFTNCKLLKSTKLTGFMS